jgi:hypothetical protein
MWSNRQSTIPISEDGVVKWRERKFGAMKESVEWVGNGKPDAESVGWVGGGGAVARMRVMAMRRRSSVRESVPSATFDYLC